MEILGKSLMSDKVVYSMENQVFARLVGVCVLPI